MSDKDKEEVNYDHHNSKKKVGDKEEIIVPLPFLIENKDFL